MYNISFIVSFNNEIFEFIHSEKCLTGSCIFLPKVILFFKKRRNLCCFYCASDICLYACHKKFPFFETQEITLEGIF